MNKVLLVEDDKLVSSIYRNKLTFEGLDVQVALDGQAALELVASFEPDLIVLDLMLPKLSGIEVLRQVRATEETKQTPVIVFTNTYMASKVHEAYACGATKCLCKAACPPKELVGAVKSALALLAAAPQPEPAPSPSRAAPRPRSSSWAANPSALTELADDRQFRQTLRQTFRDSLPGTAAELRSLLQKLLRSAGLEEKSQLLEKIARKAHSLSSTASICELGEIARLCDAFEVFIQGLREPGAATPSALRTVASVLDCLLYLHEQGLPTEADFPRANVLVVDDDAICRKAAVRTLRRVKLDALSLADPGVALAVAAENSFNLILLDVDMAGINGFELCSRIRKIPLHRDTPVVFITSHDHFENRVSSTQCGANDFIAKPFGAMELALKAFIFVLRGQLADRKARDKAYRDPAGGTATPAQLNTGI